MKKIINIGTEDFKKIIEGNFFYVDKTKLIEDVYFNSAEVSLFTRPRRFGKTLNMSMLRYFFDIENREENRKLFNDLYIGKTDFMKYQGQYPVIFLSLKEVTGNTFEQMINKTKILISYLFEDFSFLEEKIDPDLVGKFKNHKTENINLEHAAESLKFLSRLLYKYYGEKVVVIIDEYDAPIIAAHKNGYYREAVDFFRDFYGAVLKTNPNMERAFLTGIIRVSNENIFSGINNLELYSVLEPEFKEFFGLTENEVKNSLKYYDLEDKFEDVKKWYDGYKFDGTEMYNVLSILKFLKKKKFEAYWTNTSGNYLIMKHLEGLSSEGFKDLVDVFNDAGIAKEINKNSELNEMIDPQNFWELMLFSGYLTIDKEMPYDEYLLKIPNLEIKSYFKKKFISENFRGNKDFHQMIESLLREDFKTFEEKLSKIIKEELSYHDTDKDEKYYHMFILGLISSIRNNYIIKSNIETGYGRSDIAIYPRNNKKHGFIIEFKVAKSEDDMNKKLTEAMEQINENEYVSMLNEIGIQDINKVAMVFYKKKILMQYSK